MKTMTVILLSLLPLLANASITGDFPGGRLLFEKEVYREGDNAPIFYIPEGQFIRILPKVKIRREATDGKLYASHRPGSSYPKTGINLFDFTLGEEVVADSGNDVGPDEYIVGPAAVQFRTLNYLTDSEGILVVEYYSLTESGNNSATVHGLNPVLEMSLDLRTWVPYSPGSMPVGVSQAFFRVKVERVD